MRLLPTSFLVTIATSVFLLYARTASASAVIHCKQYTTPETTEQSNGFQLNHVATIPLTNLNLLLQEIRWADGWVLNQRIRFTVTVGPANIDGSGKFIAQVDGTYDNVPQLPATFIYRWQNDQALQGSYWLNSAAVCQTSGNNIPFGVAGVDRVLVYQRVRK